MRGGGTRDVIDKFDEEFFFGTQTHVGTFGVRSVIGQILPKPG
jgi:hypothetical protein